MKKFTSLVLLALIGLSSNVFAQWQYSGSNIYYDGGNVGIGTSNLSDPDQFVISSVNHAILRLKSTAIDGDSWRIMSQTSGAFVIRDEDIYADRITILKNGNIGFGVSDPSVKLEVVGKIKSSGVNSALILVSPDGTQWEITVDNSGNILTSVTTKTSEVENGKNINVYPNPTENNIKIELNSDGVREISVELYDISGKMIYMKSYKTNSVNLNLSDFETGTYVLKVKNNEGQIIKTEKVVKK